MTGDPKQESGDELELKSEVIGDLDVDSGDAEGVVGGRKALSDPFEGCQVHANIYGHGA